MQRRSQFRAELTPSQQALWNHAQSIAQTYPATQRNVYTAEAETLRIPYWDWAANPALPAVVTTPAITINGPGGVVTVKNPLYQYNFPAGSPESDFQGLQPVSTALRTTTCMCLTRVNQYSGLPFTVRHWNAQYNQSIQANATAALLANAPG